MISPARILVTGPTSQVAFPIVRELAREHTVYALARYGRAEDRARIEALGAQALVADLAVDDLSIVPAELDYVLNFAVVKSFDGSFDYDLAANVEGVGRLMSACRGVRGFLHCSSTAVYQAAGHRRVRETDPLGDNHRAIMPTYSICKIAAESMVRFGARQWSVPATIARLNVPYGDNGGWPAFHLEMMLAGMKIGVTDEGLHLYNPLHEDDYIAHLPRLLDLADVPPLTLNWGGSEQVSLEAWCRHLGELTGLVPEFETTPHALGSVTVDLSRMHELVGPTKVRWPDGIRRMVEALHPELLAAQR